ncbi:hypothetical protein [Flavobacterium sp. LHD-85]|uniref:hypothetical protein n=1 Tax=Flavobacterium sp. LHD-85 TaxID=3071410 RepID=UPI0027DEEC4F|nr:hypothetical protein [Flavobacterium sp. LHD-85]MDQ6531277.1 hypothetical protein [Flavobacterium sp. LHD-85]
MATDRTNIGYKFEKGDIPSQEDFQEVFKSFVHIDEDKADFQMVEAGTDNQHYVTPALLYTGLKNIGIITGNNYMPRKEHFDSFVGDTITLQYAPVNYSVKVFKNGQLLLEKESQGNDGDYIINYEMAKITFSGNIDNRNIEVDYWYKNLAPNSNPGGGAGQQIDFTSFLHTSGNETKNGILTFNNTTPTSTSGIVLTNSGTDTGAKVLDVTVSGAGSGIAVQNTATGTGIKVSNTGAGAGLQVNSSSATTGDPFQVTKDNVVKAKIDAEGIVTAKRFVSEGGTEDKFVKGDGSFDDKIYAEDTKVIHTSGNETKDGALKLTHNTSADDVLTIEKNNSANCLKLVQNSSSSATTSTFDTNTDNVNRKAISVQKIQVEKAFITHDGNVSGTSFTTLNEKADITDGFLTLAASTSATAMAGHAKLYAKTDGTTDLYVMGSDGVEKKIGASGGDLDNVLHKTGYATETKTGELIIDSGTADISGLKLLKLSTIPTKIETVHSSPIYSSVRNLTKDNNGNIYITTLDNGLYKMLPDESVSLLSSTARGMASCVDSSGNIYTIPYASKGYVDTPLFKTTPSGVTSTLTTNVLLSASFSICIGNDGALYIPSGYGLIRLTTDGLNISIYNSIITNRGITKDTSGNFYLPKATDGSIIKLAPNGVATFFASGIRVPEGISTRMDGSFLATDYFNTDSKLFSITTSGSVSELFSGSPLLYPNGVVETPSGIYISQLNGPILKISIGSNKVLKTDSSGLLVKTTYLEDVPYLRPHHVTNFVDKTTNQTITSTKTFYSSNTDLGLISMTSTRASVGLFTLSNSGVGSTCINSTQNDTTGKNLVLNAGTASNGFAIESNNNGVTTFSLNKIGNVTANSFIKSGGTSSQYLMADGSVTTSASASLEPSQITITTTTSITTDTLDANGKKQIGKNVIISNGTSAINIIVNGGTDFNASYLKHGTGAITFVQGTGRTLVLVDGNASFNGTPGSTATISSIGTIDYLRISNA